MSEKEEYEYLRGWRVGTYAGWLFCIIVIGIAALCKFWL